MKLSQNPWKAWKNKTKIEKDSIKKIIRSRNKIIKSVPKSALVSIYIKGSFTRREMKKGSDIDLVPIVTRNKYQKNIFSVNSKELSPCMIVPLSLEELKTNKLSTKPKRKIELRAKPDDFLRKLDQFMIIFGKPLNPKKFNIRSPKKILDDEIKVIKKGYLPYFISGEIPFEPLLKEVFWMTEAELDYKKIPHGNTFEEISRAIEDKNHIIHDAIKLRKKKKITEKEKKEFVRKLKRWLK